MVTAAQRSGVPGAMAQHTSILGKPWCLLLPPWRPWGCLGGHHANDSTRGSTIVTGKMQRQVGRTVGVYARYRCGKPSHCPAQLCPLTHGSTFSGRVLWAPYVGRRCSVRPHPSPPLLVPPPLCAPGRPLAGWVPRGPVFATHSQLTAEDYHGATAWTSPAEPLGTPSLCGTDHMFAL